MGWLDTITGFDWDDGNRDKNWLKHRVSNRECEEIFFNLPLIVAHDEQHSQREHRLFALGKTNVGRRLFIASAIRDKLIRVISARDMSRQERAIYAKANS